MRYLEPATISVPWDATESTPSRWCDSHAPYGTAPLANYLFEAFRPSVTASNVAVTPVFREFLYGYVQEATTYKKGIIVQDEPVNITTVLFWPASAPLYSSWLLNTDACSPPVLNALPPAAEATLPDRSQTAQLIGEMAAWLGAPASEIVRLFGLPSEEPAQWSEPTRRHLEEVHRTLAHVYAAAGRDSRRAMAILVHRQAPDVPTVAEHLAHGRFDEAYLAAVEALHPPRGAGLLHGQQPQTIVDGTVAVFDEE